MLVVSRMQGTVTFEQMLEHQNLLVRDPQFLSTMDQLVDTTSADEINLSFEELRTIATRGHFSPHSHRAIVVSNSAHYGLAREFAGLCEVEGTQEKIFITRSMKEAMAWLRPAPEILSEPGDRGQCRTHL